MKVDDDVREISKRTKIEATQETRKSISQENKKEDGTRNYKGTKQRR